MREICMATPEESVSPWGCRVGVCEVGTRVITLHILVVFGYSYSAKHFHTLTSSRSRMGLNFLSPMASGTVTLAPGQ